MMMREQHRVQRQLERRREARRRSSSTGWLVVNERAEVAVGEVADVGEVLRR